MVSTSSSDAFFLVESFGTGTSRRSSRFFCNPPATDAYCHARMVLGRGDAILGVEVEISSHFRTRRLKKKISVQNIEMRGFIEMQL